MTICKVKILPFCLKYNSQFEEVFQEENKGNNCDRGNRKTDINLQLHKPLPKETSGCIKT